MHTNIYIGIDAGTSGIRACAIDTQGKLIGETRQSLPLPKRNGHAIEQDPQIWWDACQQVLRELTHTLDPTHICAIAIDGTSGTVLLSDAQGRACTPALMYNDARAITELARVQEVAPAQSGVNAVSAGLPKILWLAEHYRDNSIAHIMHQADWLSCQLSRQPGYSDSNNCLKSGYDPLTRQWPDWLGRLDLPRQWLPKVCLPGQGIKHIDAQVAESLSLSPNVLIVSGTTDSTAAIIATGAQHIGDAVTSLGSTLVCKIISDKPVFASEYGVYSQPYGEHWLVGGGSNSGGAVLRQYFTDTQMSALSAQIDPEQPTQLDYYPLPGRGERFPINNPEMEARLSPRPSSDVKFFQGLLEGVARIEYNAYRRLHELGAPYPRTLRSVGGGAANPVWTRIRARQLQTPLLDVEHSEAAYGSALLAQKGFIAWQAAHKSHTQ